MRRMDSDDEPPAAAAAVYSGTMVVPHGVVSLPVPRTQHAVALVCSRESDSLTELYVQLKHRYDGLSTLPPVVPAVVSFCVGGKAFATSRGLLEKDPGSLLFALAAEHYSGAAHAREAPCGPVLIPHRNARLFGMLLNLLRGYHTAIPEEWAEVCREEAAYYGLLRSWCARFHVPSAQHYFRNPMRNSKLASEAVLGMASDFLTTGEHHIDFCVSQCERVAVGLISSGALTPDEPGTQLHDGHHGAFYWNDGKLSLYLGESRVVETGFPFPANSVIRVAFDADERIARWVVNGDCCVAMERLPAGRQYAFSSIAARTSQVEALSLSEVAAMAAFADDFESGIASVCLQHDQLSAAMEERVGRLAIWDGEEEARHELIVSAHAALTAVLTAWHNDAEKRLYTQRLMRAYYERVASGAALKSEIDERRARLASDAATC